MSKNLEGKHPAASKAEEVLAYASTLRQKKMDQMQVRYTLADGVRLFRVGWEKLMKEHYPETPVTPVSPKRDVPRIKRSVVGPLKGANIMVGEFLNFTFEHWTLIRQSPQFRNFKTYPDKPALAWFLKFADLYVSVFVDYQTLNNTIFEEPAQKKRQERETQRAESTSKVVRVARDELRKKEAEIAKLRRENRALQSKVKPRITKRTAKPTDNNLPEWE